ncbi:uncharacterized protein UDID_17965 [Ustilago sp. UG-2017a]|nr:uncharacterized protein UDID_17965 [Ustilago sp. UG-2017a]
MFKSLPLAHTRNARTRALLSPFCASLLLGRKHYLRGVRGRAPETQLLSRYRSLRASCSATIKMRGDSGWRLWLGTINIDMKGMVTPRSGVSVDDDGDEVDDVGDEIVIPGPQWTTAFGSIYIRTANLLWAPSDVSYKRVPSSSSTVQGGPSSTTPVLLSCVNSFDTAPPPCLAPLCLLSGVDFFDTAPPPQDLLAGLLCTAPPPSTGDGSFGSYLSSP